MRISTAGIARKKNTFFLAQRKAGTSIGQAWEFPGGKKRDCEDSKECLVREFKEELNVAIEVEEIAYTGEFSNKGVQYTQEAFFVKLLSEDFVLTEHQDYGWFSLEEIQKLPLAESDKSIVLALHKNKKI